MSPTTVAASLLAFGLLATFRVALSSSASPQQIGSEGSTQSGESGRKLSPSQIAQLLGKPDGLHAAAQLVGKFYLSISDERFSYLDLATLTRTSSLIVHGIITQRSPRLISDGDIIVTDYSVAALDVLKGNVTGTLSFTAEGGLVTFPDGSSAELSTLEWRGPQEGKEYVIFLSKAGDQRYHPTSGSESFFGASAANNGQIYSLASESHSPHSIPREIKSMDTSTFLFKLRSWIAAVPNGNLGKPQ